MIIIQYRGRPIKRKKSVSSFFFSIVKAVQTIKGSINIWILRKNPNTIEKYINKIVSQIRDDV